MDVERKPASSGALILLVVLTAGGCGTSHLHDDAAVDGGPPDATPTDGAFDGGPPDAAIPQDAGRGLTPTFVEFCTRVRELRCAGASCCTIPSRASTAGCEAAEIRARCEGLGDDPALRDGTLVWDADAAARHVEALESALPTCGAIDRRFNPGVVLHGTLGEGDDCTPHDPEGSLGRFRCRDGLRCAITGTVSDYTGRCAPPGTLGDSCNYDCGDGLFCQWTTELNPWVGFCETQDDGAECYSDYACSEMFCVVQACETPSPADTWCAISG